jgi:4-amino-4-deoxy-L-arabinose transferase-like glycosyltransferase
MPVCYPAGRKIGAAGSAAQRIFIGTGVFTCAFSGCAEGTLKQAGQTSAADHRHRAVRPPPGGAELVPDRQEARLATTVVDSPLSPAGYDDGSGAATGHPRWQVWRSPPGQPPWARPALLGIAAVAALLFAWNIADAGLAPFYSVAVKSMSVSWKAFFYGALDPKATITIDKLAGSFAPQALSARIFGYHPWSLALPQVIEGVIATLAMYRVVRRWAGPVPGLLAAGIFALTPIAASMFGHSMEDGLLTMCLVLAADAYQRAVMEARLRSLLWSGFWVGVGFQAKMLQAWMVLPALAIGYLVAAPAPVRRRLGQLGVATVVMLAVSLSWIALYTFTPVQDRPYVDGSTNNSAISMVFGYNGLERFGISVPGSVTSGPGVSGGAGARTGAAPGGAAPGGAAPGGAAPGGTAPGGTAPGGTGEFAAPNAVRAGAASFGQGWTKLLGSEFGPQVGWLYPLAVLALIFGLLWTRRARRTDQVRAGFVMWGVWLLTFGLIFSKMSSIPHTAYVASLAPPVAALSAAGIVMFWRYFRSGDARGWVLPVAVAAEAAWALFLRRDYGTFLPWLRIVIVVAAVIGIGLMVAVRLTRRATARLMTIGLTAGVGAMLIAPAAWAGSVLDAKYAGSSFNATAGPASAAGGFGGGGPAAGNASAEDAFRDFADRLGERTGTGTGPGGTSTGQAGSGTFGGGAGGAGGAGGIQGSATTTLTSSEKAIYDYVSAHRDGASYLLAVSSWETASPYIEATGQEVMPMGGFSGSVPEPTLAHVEQLVKSGQLKFFLLDGTGTGGGGGFGGRGGTGSTVSAIESWVENTCRTVPATDYAGTTTGTGGTLYACSASS